MASQAPAPAPQSFGTVGGMLKGSVLYDARSSSRTHAQGHRKKPCGRRTLCDLRTKLGASEGSLPLFLFTHSLIFQNNVLRLNTKLLFRTVDHIADQLRALWFHPDVTAHQKTIFFLSGSYYWIFHSGPIFAIFRLFLPLAPTLWQFLCHLWPIWRSQWDSLPFLYPPAV